MGLTEAGSLDGGGVMNTQAGLACGYREAAELAERELKLAYPVKSSSKAPSSEKPS